METLESHRNFFAHLVATTAREKFVGPGPWKVFAGGTLIDTPTSDPAFLYQDVVVSLAADRHINNGQPVLHAICLAALNIQPGGKNLAHRRWHRILHRHTR